MAEGGMGRRGLLGVAVAVVAGALSGCGALRTELDEKRNGGRIDFGGVESAVPAAVPRVTAVTEPRRSRNGFAYRAGFVLLTSAAEPFTGEQLDDVVRTIWTTLPWEVNALHLVAVTDTPEGTGVDLRAAAATLAPLSVTDAGRNGVALTGMEARYGAWTEPR